MTPQRTGSAAGRRSKRTRAQQLIEELLESGRLDESALAKALVVPPPVLAAFRKGKGDIPLDRQLCLALLALELDKRFHRLGRQLKEQVAAAIAYETHETTVHSDSKPAFWR